MAYESYKLSLPPSTSIRGRMLGGKERQIRFLYGQAMDREEGVLLNGEPFAESPRVFDRKFVDTIHHKITVETILDGDWIECGDYLEYGGMVWLCLNSYSFHGLYCRATFMSCDWEIYWVNEDGELKSQYVVDQNSTQYNSGETGGRTMTIGSAQHMLKMQCNDDTVVLDSPVRFAIDRNAKNPTCYKVTQNDNSSYNYGKGLCCITVEETALDTKTDRLVALDDGKKVWVCDYVGSPHPAPTRQLPGKTGITAIISGNVNIRNGYSRTYAVSFTDKDGNGINLEETDYQWNIKSNFNVSQTVCGDTMVVSINDEGLIGASFFIQVFVGGGYVI